MKIRIFEICTLFCLVLFNSVPVYAGNAQMMKLIEILRDKGTLSQEEYELLLRASETPETSQVSVSLPRKTTIVAESPPPRPVQEKKADTAVRASTKGGLKVKAADGAFEFKVGGRIKVDAAFYDDDTSDIADGTELRNARLQVSGKMYKDWKYKAKIDFSDNEVDDKSLYIAYSGWKPVTIKAGLYGVPFGLGNVNFMEKPLAFQAFEMDDRIGLGLESGGDNWSAGIALFGEGASDNDVDDEGWGGSLRATYAPILEKSRLLHFGGSMAYQTPDSTAEDDDDLDGNGVTGENVRTVRFRARPEAHVNVGRLVDTGSIYNVDQTTSYGLEAASGLGPFSVHGEYYFTRVGRTAGNRDLRFRGYHGVASWFLTGEHRPYEADSGEFGRVVPNQNFSLRDGGPGAWEIAARYSMLDLTDETIIGGEEDNITLGVNWYINPQLRLVANYVMVDVDTANGAGDDPNISKTRVRMDF